MTTTERTAVPAIRFDSTLETIDEWTILRLPEKASEKLPSRGQVAVRGTINGHQLQTVLEPDGSSGHWMMVDRDLQQMAGISVGDNATLEIERTEDWPEPERKPRPPKQRNLRPEQVLRAIGHRRDTPSTGAWLPGTHAGERAAVPGDIGRGNPGGGIDGAMIRGPARPGCALM